MAATTATNHWKLGLFVVGSILVAVAAIFWLAGRGLRRESFAAVSYFDESVQGLDVGSPLKFRGVTVGTVKDITIAPDRRNVQVTSDIYVDALRRLGLDVPRKGGQFIDPDLRVQLASAGITGVRYIQTDFFDPKRFPPPALPFEPPWNYVPSAPSTLKSVGDAAASILDRLPAVEDRVNDTLVDFRQTLRSVDRLVGTLGADEGSFNRLLVELRTAAVHAEAAIDQAKLGATTASLRAASGTVGQAATDVGDVRDELRGSLIALRETLDAVRALAATIDRDPSTILRGPAADAPYASDGR